MDFFTILIERLNIGKLSKNVKLKKKFKLKIIFPNQTRISLENFQTKLDLVWNLFTPQIRHKKFPNQSGFGLENCDNIFRITFPNQTGFGLETDTV